MTGLWSYAAPEFPASFDVSTDGSAVTVTQGIDEDNDSWMIEVNGKTTGDNITVTFNLPDGWTSVIGGEVSFGIMRKAVVTADDDDEEWVSVDMFKLGMESMYKEDSITQGLSFTFPADGETRYGMYALCVGDQVYVGKMFELLVTVEKGEGLSFPSSFDITSDSSDVTITQEVEDEQYMIYAEGATSKSTVTLTFDLPDGWTSVIGGEVSYGGYRTGTSDPGSWVSVDEYKAGLESMIKEGTLAQGLSFTYPADGEPHVYMYALCSGDKVYVEEGIIMQVIVEQFAGAPEFPSEIGVESSDESLEIEQSMDEGDLYVLVGGTTTDDTVTLTLDLPAPWAGVLGGIMEMSDARTAGVTDSWPSVDTMIKEIGDAGVEVIRGNKVTFEVKDNAQLGMFYLYTEDEKVETSHVLVISFNVDKFMPAPEFPESLNLTCADPNVVINEERDPMGEVTVDITGSAKQSSITVSMTLPEPWAGAIGGITDVEETRTSTGATDYWPSVSDIKAEWEEMGMDVQQGTEFTFPVDAKQHNAMFYLYTNDDKVDTLHGILVSVLLDYEVGVDSIESSDADAVYYDLQGRKVERPETGIYVKVSSSKVSKEIVK